MATEAEDVPISEPPRQRTTGAATTTAEAGNGGTPSDLIGWFNSEIEKNAATFIVYYRGLW
jgi:hypothetical protein